MNKRELVFQKITPLCMVLLGVFEIGMGIYYVVQGRPYYYLMAFGGLLFLPLPYFMWKLLRLQPVYQLNFVIYAFVFLAFSIGIVLAGYYRIPYYDKVMHTLSGVFVAFLSLALFYWLKPEKKIEKRDCSLASVFVFACSMAVAGIWELCEYILSLLTGMDPQNVMGTGVSDTMQDMIVCLIGTLLFLIPLIIYYRKGKKEFFMGAFEVFFEYNYSGAAQKKGIAGARSSPMQNEEDTKTK